MQAERLPSMRLYREDIERRFVHTEIFGLGLQDSGSNGDNDEDSYFGDAECRYLPSNPLVRILEMV